MPTNRPTAIAGFPKDNTNAFGDVRLLGLRAVARTRNSQVKNDDLIALLEYLVEYTKARNGPTGNGILASGAWNDAGQWDDTANWNDEA